MATPPDRWRQWSKQLARDQEERPPLYAPARRTIVMTTQAPSSMAPADPEMPSVAAAHPPVRQCHSAPANRGPRSPTRTGADPLRDNPVLTDLVTRAAQGDKRAWDALVERYAP